MKLHEDDFFDEEDAEVLRFDSFDDAVECCADRIFRSLWMRETKSWSSGLYVLMTKGIRKSPAARSGNLRPFLPVSAPAVCTAGVWHGSLAAGRPALLIPRFADIFQQGNRWLNWLEKQPEGAVCPVVIESVTKIMACGTTLMGYTQWCCSSPDCCHTKKVCFRCKAALPALRVKAGAQWIQYLLSLVPTARGSILCSHFPASTGPGSTTGGYWQR